MLLLASLVLLATSSAARRELTHTDNAARVGGCTDTCKDWDGTSMVDDDYCDDGGMDSDFSSCPYGTDCKPPVNVASAR